MKELTFKTVWVIVIGALTFATLILGLLGSFGISPVEAKQTIQVVATIVNEVAVTVNDINANINTEDLAQLNETLKSIDPELVALLKIYLEQETRR